MKKFNILYINKNQKNKEFEQDLKNFLINNNFKYSNDDYNYLFIIGGDGSFLKIIKDFLFKNIKIIFINTGTIGFFSYTNNLNNININDLLDENNYQSLDLIKTEYKTNCWYSINESCIQSNYVVNTSININNAFLETFDGNGVLISTPLGSTARNRSLNGAIILPNVEALTLKEIEPLTNKINHPLYSSLIVNKKDIINVYSKFKNHWWILIDGQEYPFSELEANIKISSIKSKCKVLLQIDYEHWFKKI